MQQCKKINHRYCVASTDIVIIFQLLWSNFVRKQLSRACFSKHGAPSSTTRRFNGGRSALPSGGLPSPCSITCGLMTPVLGKSSGGTFLYRTGGSMLVVPGTGWGCRVPPCCHQSRCLRTSSPVSNWGDPNQNYTVPFDTADMDKHRRPVIAFFITQHLETWWPPNTINTETSLLYRYLIALTNDQKNAFSTTVLHGTSNLVPPSCFSTNVYSLKPAANIHNDKSPWGPAAKHLRLITRFLLGP